MRRDEDDFSSYQHSRREAEQENQEDDQEFSDYGYRYSLTLPNSNTLLFDILDDDQDFAGHILCTAEGKITVLFDERWTYDQSDVDSLQKQVQKFFDAL